jgi:predicted house-cleaning noncanonical NTP pyrophosphatase (MazG superfamily)
VLDEIIFSLAKISDNIHRMVGITNTQIQKNIRIMIKKRRFKVEKLIRDKIPEYLRQQNVHIEAQEIDQDEYIYHLKLKLLEEAQEVIDAGNVDELVEEIADVMEVLHALVKMLDISYAQIEQRRLYKKEQSGAFEKRIYSSYVEVESGNDKVEYYLTRPDKYPEILSDRN